MTAPTRTAPEHRLRASVLSRVSRLGGRLPDSVIRVVLRTALGDGSLALCLHRVGDRPSPRSAAVASCTIAADRLDRLIDLLRASRPPGPTPWLTVTFDDGYDDAASYVGSRAPRYPDLEFIFFVCPEKTERGAGFRWDAVDEALGSGRSPGDAVAESPADVLLENDRVGLRGLGRREAYRLADVATVCALGRLPNVALGNHTNAHLRPISLTDEQAKAEYARSRDDFSRLFGPSQHFAFPYGTPYFDLEPRHIRIAGALGAPLMWSTEGRPYGRAERRPGAVLPRFPVDGTMDHRQIATQIAARSVAWRLRGKGSTLNELG